MYCILFTIRNVDDDDDPRRYSPGLQHHSCLLCASLATALLTGGTRLLQHLLTTLSGVSPSSSPTWIPTEQNLHSSVVHYPLVHVLPIKFYFS